VKSVKGNKADPSFALRQVARALGVEEPIPSGRLDGVVLVFEAFEEMS
jgi:hypothetical protein